MKFLALLKLICSGTRVFRRWHRLQDLAIRVGSDKLKMVYFIQARVICISCNCNRLLASIGDTLPKLAWYKNTHLQEVTDKVCQDFYQWKRGISFSGFSMFGYNLGGLKQTQNKRSLLVADVRRRYDYGPFEFEWKSYLRKMMISAARRLWTTTWLRNLETIPYSNRTHLVLLRRKTEKRMGERNFKKIKGKHQEKILPPTHPTSARVTLIAQNLIRALKTDLRAHDKVRGASNPASKSKSTFWQELLKEITRKRCSRYLDHVNWEVIVVDDPGCYNATCYLGGKIVVFTGLLKQLESDAEIATVIGHEIAHAVARHRAEKRTIGMGLRVLTLGIMSDHLIQKLSSRFVMLPLSRKFELEADYIGLLLMASAGYDPRVAVGVREKSAKRRGDGSHRTKYFSRRTHPTGKERAHFLAQAQEEAMTLYRKNIVPEQSP